jgi:hypothetical protein
MMAYANNLGVCLEVGMPTTDWSCLKWDSEFFGFPVAEARLPGFDPSAIRSVLSEAKTAGISLLVMKSEQELDLPEGYDVELVDVSQRLTFDFDAAAMREYNEAKLSIVAVQDEVLTDDILRLGRMGGTFSRFRADPHFPKSQADRLFEAWVRRPAQCPDLFKLHVAQTEDGQVAGILVSELRDGVGRPSLLAVDRRFRGPEFRLTEGFFLAAWRWFESCGANRGEVVTQRRNRAAMVAYTALGWQPAGVEYVYHAWLKTPGVQSTPPCRNSGSALEVG